jgi:hypothetical protein
MNLQRTFHSQRLEGFLALAAAGRQRYQKLVEQWNEEHLDDQLVLNKAGFAVRKPKSRVDLEKKAQREKELAEKRRKKVKRYASVAATHLCTTHDPTHSSLPTHQAIQNINCCFTTTGSALFVTFVCRWGLLVFLHCGSTFFRCSVRQPPRCSQATGRFNLSVHCSQRNWNFQ